MLTIPWGCGLGLMKGLIPVAQSVHLRYFYIFNIIMKGLTDSEATCPIHPSTVAIYYAVEQPWVKFCSECALNLALSGKKIEKQLSAEEYDTKTKLLNINERMKSAAKNADAWHTQLGKMAEETEEQGRTTLRKIIVDFNEYVNTLIRIREEIVDTFEENFGKKAQELYERQTKVMLSQIQLKRDIEYIQINFGKIVENKDHQDFEQKTNKWAKNIQTMQQYTLQSFEKDQLTSDMIKTSAEIRKKLRELPAFEISQNQSENPKTPEQQVEGRQSTSKTNQSERFHSRMSSVITYGDENLEQGTKGNTNRTITQLKLRSKSKKNEKKSQKQESSRRERRSSIRQISNLINLHPFHL